MDQRDETTKRRKRAALSCEQCRRRKIKCNRSKPCEHCKLSKLDCSYRPFDNVQAPEYVTSVFSVQGSARDAPSSSSGNQTTPSSQQQSDFGQGQASGDGGGPSQSAQSSSSQLIADSAVDSASVTLPCVQHAKMKGIFSENRYVGQSHWMNSILTLRLPTVLVLQQEADPNSEIHHLTQKCKAAIREIQARDKTLANITPNASNYLPSRELADKLVRSYLETFESIYRVVHIPSFQQEYESYWMDPRPISEDLSKLFLIMAIGVVFQPLQEATVLRSSALRWINVAQSLISAPCEKYRMTIEGVQVQCLFIFARLVHDVDGDLLRVSAGSLLQTAMGMGLHIDAAVHKLPGTPARDIQLRRKLWATVLEIVAQTSIDAGAVPLIRAADYDCKPPLNIDDDADMNRDFIDLASSAEPEDRFTQCSLQIMLSRSLPLRLETVAFVNDFRLDSTTYEKAMSLSERLTQSCASFVKLFQSFKQSTRCPTDFQVYMIELLTHQYLFALHSRYAFKAKSDPTFYYSRKVCLDTARLFLPTCSQMMDFSYNHLRLWGGGIFQAIPLQATGFIAEELLLQIETDTSFFSKDRKLTSGRNELRKYIEEYITSAIIRIQHGHTNVRPYVQTSALLAQIDALLDGRPVEESILAALKNGLATCYEVLCGRLGESACECDVASHMQNELWTNEAAFLQDYFPPESLLDPNLLANLDWWHLSGDMESTY